MKGKLKFGIVGLVGLMLLSSCAGSVKSTNSQSESINSDKEISFVKTGQEDYETVWYRIYNQDSVTADTRIEAIIFTKNGKSVLYEIDFNLIFDDLEDLNTQEIKEKAKEIDEIIFKEKVAVREKEYNRMLEPAMEELEYQIKNKHEVMKADPEVLARLEESIPKLEIDKKALLELPYEEPSEKTIKSYVKIRENATVKEMIDLPRRFLYYNRWNYDGLSKKLLKNSDDGFFYGEEEFRDIDLVHLLPTAKIGNALYAGYANEDRNVFLVTKINSEKQKVVLDEIDVEGVIEK